MKNINYERLTREHAQMKEILKIITDSGNINKGTYWIVNAADMARACELLAEMERGE